MEKKIPFHELQDYYSDDITPHCLRNLYAGQEARVRTLYGTTDWLRIEEGLFIVTLFFFNLSTDTEHMIKARLDKLQAGIKIARGNINNHRYVYGNHSSSRKRRLTKESFD